MLENASPTLKFQFCHFENNSAEINLFSLDNSQIDLSHSIFQNNFNNMFDLVQSNLSVYNLSIMQHQCNSEVSGCLINAETNSMMSIDSSFFFNISSLVEGNICLMNSELFITNSMYKNIFSEEKEEVFITAESSYLSLNNTEFINFDFNYIFLETSQLFIEKCFFSANTEYSLPTTTYGTIYCMSCLSFEINESYLIGQNYVMEGAAIYLIQNNESMQTDFLIKDSVFENNSVYDNGGAIFLSYVNVSLSNCSFINNGATNGGAIYFASSSIYTYLILTNNSFISNWALQDGGAIKWTFCEPYYFGFNNFTSNVAIYGKDVASFPIRMELKIFGEDGSNVFDQTNSSDFPTLQNLVSGQNINYTFTLDFVDLYNNPVLTIDTNGYPFDNPNLKNQFL